MTQNKVKKLYSIGHAKWYDGFKAVWNRLVGKEAEKRLCNFLKENLDGAKNILELGCGTALNLEKIKSLDLAFSQYLGLDFSDDMLNIARSKFRDQPNIEFKLYDITKLDDIHKKFDIILCTWVLSHLTHPADVINNAQKLLKANGKMFLIFFSRPKWFIRFWFNPIAKYIYRSTYVTDEIIGRFKNVKSVKHFSANITTVVEISI